jgi:hypothetical protein
MELQSIYSILLIVSFTMMVGQLSVRNKATVHILFAIFCGSMTMVAAKQLGSESLGLYQVSIAGVVSRQVGDCVAPYFGSRCDSNFDYGEPRNTDG